MMRNMMDRIFILFVIKIAYCNSFQKFQNLIPNGKNSPNPCTSGLWQGLGHIGADGGGDRNPFGVDFKRAEMKWTSNLCNMDSDNDGLSNGEELGDPDCLWTPGQQPKRTENISHPGICEPLTSSTCQQQNKWLLNCDGNKDTCESLNEKGTLRTSIRLPATSIPSKQTSYYCMLFRLPRNDTFHLVGTKPIIDNKDITHHILLFGCNEQEGQIVPSKTPYECGMLAHRQFVNIIGTWTVGSGGDCFHNATGFKIGSSGFQTAALQIHWNNRNGIPNMTDSSGLELFYTPNLRQYEAVMFVVGQEYLNIPPRVPNISFRSRCSSACTEVMFPKGVFITRAVNHMHYKGIQQNIEIYRGNKKRNIHMSNQSFINLIHQLRLVLGMKSELHAHILPYRQTKLFSLVKELPMKCATDLSHIILRKI